MQGSSLALPLPLISGTILILVPATELTDETLQCKSVIITYIPDPARVGPRGWCPASIYRPVIPDRNATDLSGACTWFGLHLCTTHFRMWRSGSVTTKDSKSLIRQMTAEWPMAVVMQSSGPCDPYGLHTAQSTLCTYAGHLQMDCSCGQRHIFGQAQWHTANTTR